MPGTLALAVDLPAYDFIGARKANYLTATWTGTYTAGVPLTAALAGLSVLERIEALPTLDPSSALLIPVHDPAAGTLKLFDAATATELAGAYAFATPFTVSVRVIGR